MSRQVIEFLQEALAEGRACFLCTVSGCQGETPAVPGALMAVRDDGQSLGTVGGGASEAALSERCIRAMREGSGSFSFQYELNAQGGLNMVCGGSIEGYARAFLPEARLIIFGGGHVGRAVAQAGALSGFSVTVVDDREMEEARYGGARLHRCADFSEAATGLAPDRNSYAVIVTRGHAQDYAVLRALVETDAAYIGMIGSRRKVAASLARMAGEGVPPEAIGRLYAPIGLDIDDGTPGQIALSILSEILLVKNNGTLRHCREKLTEHTNEKL